MTLVTAWASNTADFSRDRLLGDALLQRIIGGAAAMSIAAVCAWAICLDVGGGSAMSAVDAAAARADKLPLTAERADKLAMARVPHRAISNIVDAGFESRFAAAFPPGVFAWNAPITSGEVPPTVLAPALAAQGSPQLAGRRLAENEPAAPPRRTQRANLPAPDETVQADADAQAAQTDQTDKPSFFERLFGRSPQAIFAKLFGSSPSGVKLAYANTDDGMTGEGTSLTTGLYDRQTAVYDIAAHTVYMPDGTTLEAHSGLGSRLDDPRYVAERDLGPTPPDIYDLKPRGALFHGVAALRLIPVDEKKVYGRAGLLAHTYMLGPNGQSNGCVSFKDYDAFLHAYENHEITRLAVVSHVD